MRYLYSLTLILTSVLVLASCTDAVVDNAASDDSQITAASPDALSKAGGIDKRRSWKNWHVHDGAPGFPFIDETGLRHVGVAVFPRIFSDYATTPSLWVYCPDGVDKGLDGGGSKAASGACQNEDYLIHLKRNKDATKPAPAGWTELTPPPGGFYYWSSPIIADS